MESQTTKATEAAPGVVSTVLSRAARRLIAGGIDGGVLDAQVLLGHVLGWGREQIVARAYEPLDDACRRAYESVLARRLMREPTAYITGRREFWSLDFHVNRNVLIPRPDTELLVEVALMLANESRAAQPLRIVDLGTGSGAIAVALATELLSAEIIATDVSVAALAVAEGNARRNNVGGRLVFALGDLFAALAPATSVDLVVSNPPYIRRADLDTLAPEISRWEPRCALDGGRDGLDYYRRIAAEADRWLTPKGALAVEVGAGMGETVAAIFQAAGWTGIGTYRDYAGLERVVVARKAAQ